MTTIATKVQTVVKTTTDELVASSLENISIKIMIIYKIWMIRTLRTWI